MVMTALQSSRVWIKLDTDMLFGSSMRIKRKDAFIDSGAWSPNCDAAGVAEMTSVTRFSSQTVGPTEWPQ